MVDDFLLVKLFVFSFYEVFLYVVLFLFIVVLWVWWGFKLGKIKLIFF